MKNKAFVPLAAAIALAVLIGLMGSGVRLILDAAHPTHRVGSELHDDHWEVGNPMPGWRL